MCVQVCGFSLKPAGFFTRNPCLDLAKECNAASVDNSLPQSNGNGNGNGCCNGAH